MPIGISPESLSQRILAGIILIERLGVQWYVRDSIFIPLHEISYGGGNNMCVYI